MNRFKALVYTFALGEYFIFHCCISTAITCKSKPFKSLKMFSLGYWICVKMNNMRAPEKRSQNTLISPWWYAAVQVIHPTLNIIRWEVHPSSTSCSLLAVRQTMRSNINLKVYKNIESCHFKVARITFSSDRVLVVHFLIGSDLVMWLCVKGVKHWDLAAEPCSRWSQAGNRSDSGS